MPRNQVQIHRPLRPNLHRGIFECLVDHPRTLEELRAAFQERERAICELFGYLAPREPMSHYGQAAETLPEDLAALARTGWIAHDGERYTLTPAWRELALLTSAEVCVPAAAG